MRRRVWRANLTALSLSLLAVAGIGLSASVSAPSFKGEWSIVETWSEKDYLTRLNVLKGTKLIVESNGFMKAGQLGIDGILGLGVCGANCATVTVNGLNQSYDATLGGRWGAYLILTNDSPALIIVAKRID